MLTHLLGTDWRDEAAGADYEIHLALHGTESLEIGGYLVTEKGSVDRVIAFCPVRLLEPGDLRKELSRLLRVARRVARGTITADSDDPRILWFRHESGPLPVPLWIYALACIPLSGEWDGRFQTPCPFCPMVMERLAAQPEAIAWLKGHHLVEPAGMPDCGEDVGLNGGAG